MTAFRKAIAQKAACALPGHYYTAADIFQQENQRVFANHWLCVGRSEQIPQVGDYFLVQVAEESLIVLRDASGIARAFFNVCRHRGTRLCHESEGRFLEAIQCPYHAWTYDLKGQLQATRHIYQMEGFTTKDSQLYACTLHEWEGFLWVNLAANPVPFAQSFSPLLSRFTPWQLATLRVGHRIDYEVAANWKLIFQNYSESYHCPPAHPRLSRLSPAQSGQNDLLKGAFLGGYLSRKRAVRELSLGDRSSYLPLPERRDQNLDRVYYYSLFPTMLLSLHPDYVVTHRLCALDTGRTQIICEWLFAPQAIDRPDFDPSEAIELWDLTNRQDWLVCELTQQEVSSRTYQPAPYADQEGLLVAFDQEYLRVMGR